jgi:hypothetical protein
MAKTSMIKLPTNRTLYYETGDLSTAGYTGVSPINLVRDLAAINRHNVAHTTSKGVPLVYRCAVTILPKIRIETGSGNYSDVFHQDAEMVQVADFQSAPNTWVLRNAMVKAHAARENMFKQQGVKKSERGAYSKTIRPVWDGTPGSFLTPKHYETSGGADMTMGTWDYTALKADDGDLNHIKLSYAGITDDSIMAIYLASRGQIRPDSNTLDDNDNQPADSNILRQLLSPTLGISSKDDDVVALARDEQDNPPYDLTVSQGDASHPVLLGRQMIGGRAGLTSTEIYDIPCGIMNITALNVFMDGGASNRNIGLNIKVEVLGAYEM